MLFATSPPPLHIFQPSPFNKLAFSSQSYAEMCDSSKRGLHAKDPDPSMNALKCLRSRAETFLCFWYDSQAPKLGTPVVLFFPFYHRVSLLELTISKKDTLIILGLLGNLAKTAKTYSFGLGQTVPLNPQTGPYPDALSPSVLITVTLP